jgi:phosphoenolpyruvate carboxykinase (GTP)
MGSETTAAATGAVGVVRRDPMAMLPFCGYNMGEYLAHWLGMRSRIEKLPPIFMVNWFRKGDDGKFLWPGYGENMRVLKWIVERAAGQIGAKETPVGWIPRAGDIELTGLAIDPERFRAATDVDPNAWRAELESQGEFLATLGDSLPRPLALQRELLLASLAAAR